MSSSAMNSATTKSQHDSENPSDTKIRFYGLAEHRGAGGIFSSILRRKGRKLAMAEECKAVCKHMETYKTSADKLHQSMMYILVENAILANKLSTADLNKKLDIDKAYASASEYLKTFDKVQKLSRKGEYENLDPSIVALRKVGQEYEKYVKKEMEILKPFSKFIRDEYWEYARLRRVYWEALEAYDEALTIQNKERTEESEKATHVAQEVRNECRQRMMDFINKVMEKDKPKHIECVFKFHDEAARYHIQVGEILHTIEPKESQPTSGISKVK